MFFGIKAFLRNAGHRNTYFITTEGPANTLDQYQLPVVGYIESAGFPIAISSKGLLKDLYGGTSPYTYVYDSGGRIIEIHVTYSVDNTIRYKVTYSY